MGTSHKVKNWRRRTKARIVEAMGGKCVCCGYNRCDSALALHHLNPELKDFSFKSIRAVAKSWPKIAAELRKCVLVCHNCHAEIHDGVRSVLCDVPKFDESFADYRAMERAAAEDSWDECPGCGKKVPPHKKHCSTACAHGATERVDWASVDLVELRRVFSKRQIATQLGVSDKTVAKRLQMVGLS